MKCVAKTSREKQWQLPASQERKCVALSCSLARSALPLWRELLGESQYGKVLKDHRKSRREMGCKEQTGWAAVGMETGSSQRKREKEREGEGCESFYDRFSCKVHSISRLHLGCPVPRNPLWSLPTCSLSNSCTFHTMSAMPAMLVSWTIHEGLWFTKKKKSLLQWLIHGRCTTHVCQVAWILKVEKM